MFWGVGWLVSCFGFYFKAKYTWRKFCVWINSSPCPAGLFRSLRLRNQQKDTAGWSRCLWSHMLIFRPLVSLNLCVLCPSPDPFCQGALDLYLGKTLLKMWHICICTLQLLYGQMLASYPSSHLCSSHNHTSSPRSARLEVFLGRALSLSRKLLSSSWHCV